MYSYQIKVGQKYTHSSFPSNYVWLGWWRQVSDTSFVNKKCLIVLEGDRDCIGLVVKDPIDCCGGFWDGFTELNESIE